MRHSLHAHPLAVVPISMTPTHPGLTAPPCARRHMRTCNARREEHECPWGCGVRLDFANLQQHKVECLMEPRKLMAAISKLAQENERLTLENQRLREDSSADMSDGETTRVRKASRRRGPGFSID